MPVGETSNLGDAEIAHCLRRVGQPFRIGFLRALRGREPLAPHEYAKEASIKSSNPSYHCKILRDLGLIRIRESVPRRGAMENLYELSNNGRAVLAVIDLLSFPISEQEETAGQTTGL